MIQKSLIMRTIRNLFPVNNQPYNLRIQRHWECSNIHTVYCGIESISYLGPKNWDSLPNSIKLSKSLSEFKEKVKFWKPDKCTCRLCNSYIAGLGFLK